ncbi:hypothetical protein C8R43DRAFT_340715 [Mycena crocata]|nr:hypothetical protein C8R43DRAFT_340715 [Mycena crocata]
MAPVLFPEPVGLTLPCLASTLHLMLLTLRFTLHVACSMLCPISLCFGFTLAVTSSPARAGSTQVAASSSIRFVRSLTRRHGTLCLLCVRSEWRLALTATRTSPQTIPLTPPTPHPIHPILRVPCTAIHVAAEVCVFVLALHRSVYSTRPEYARLMRFASQRHPHRHRRPRRRGDAVQHADEASTASPNRRNRRRQRFVRHGARFDATSGRTPLASRARMARDECGGVSACAARALEQRP